MNLYRNSCAAESYGASSAILPGVFMTHRASCLSLPALIGVAILLAACQGPGLPPAPAPPLDPVSDDPAGEQPHMTPETPGGQPEATPGPDRRAIIVDPGALNVAEGGAAHYTVMLGSQPTGPVTVIPTPASAELTLTPAALRFTAGDWRAAKTVTVTATQDDDALADAAVQLAHEVRGGGYDGVPGVPVVVTIVEDDVSTLALAPAHASEAAGTMRFAVTLSLAHDADVTVDYATGAASDTAVEGHDYTRTTGTLSFPARSTAAQTISVAIRDDEQDEDDEWFTVTLRNPTHATLAGGAATLAATGRIDDDDSPSRVAVADASLTPD